MKLYLCGHGFRYETENLCRVFFPNEEIEVSNDASGFGSGGISVLTKTEGNTLFVWARAGGREQTREKAVPADIDDNESERELLCLLFSALSGLTGYVPPWGILTGVRPSKLMGALINELSYDAAKRYFTEKLLVSAEKTNLTADVALREEKTIKTSQKNSFSLYVAVPFCPSRCSYCSFVSHSITGNKARSLVSPYVELLTKELSEIGRIARELSLKLESVYFGGGTPTVLSAGQLGVVCEAVEKSFDLSSCREYTVEAGRPDTITKRKAEDAQRERCFAHKHKSADNERGGFKQNRAEAFPARYARRFFARARGGVYKYQHGFDSGALRRYDGKLCGIT